MQSIESSWILDRVPFAIDGIPERRLGEGASSAGLTPGACAGSWLPWGCEPEGAGALSSAPRAD